MNIAVINPCSNPLQLALIQRDHGLDRVYFHKRDTSSLNHIDIETLIASLKLDDHTLQSTVVISAPPLCSQENATPKEKTPNPPTSPMPSKQEENLFSRPHITNYGNLAYHFEPFQVNREGEWYAASPDKPVAAERWQKRARPSPATGIEGLCSVDPCAATVLGADALHHKTIVIELDASLKKIKLLQAHATVRERENSSQPSKGMTGLKSFKMISIPLEVVATQDKTITLKTARQIVNDIIHGLKKLDHNFRSKRLVIANWEYTTNAAIGMVIQELCRNLVLYQAQYASIVGAGIVGLVASGNFGSLESATRRCVEIERLNDFLL